MGASPREVRALEHLEISEAVDRLIDYEQVPDSYPVSPWEFTTNDKNKNISNSGRLISDWWALRMATTERPMQERLALFWHDHFAVSNDKVQDGRKMLQYLQVLRTHAAGNFAQMLEEVSKTPAMIIFLDSNRNVKGKPNENFSREVMELFTLGVDGGYTETDVREAARALTGWTFRDTLNYRNRKDNPLEEQIRKKVADGTDIFQFSFAANRHDNGEKTIFGKVGAYQGDDVLKLLLDHPDTPRHICRKLWEWFVYPDPEPGIVDRLAEVFVDGDYEIKPVLREIAFSSEFWGPKAVRTKVKSPVDFTVGLMRQFNARAVLKKREPGDRDPFQPVHPDIRRFASAMNGQVRRQGLYLLHPPSVEGWHWNEEWISSETMLYRIDFARRMFANKRLMEPLMEWSVPEFAVDPERASDAKMVDRLLEFLDIEVAPDQRYVLARNARRLDVNVALYSDKATQRLWPLMKLVFAMPQAHMC